MGQSFFPKLCPTPVDLSVADIRWKIATQWSDVAQWLAYRKPTSLCRMVRLNTHYDVPPGLELSGGWGFSPPPQFMSTDAHFWVKIGFKFQFLGKISNISTSDPPALLGQFQHCNTLLTKLGPRCTSRDMSNLEWPRHISPTGHPIHFIFGSRSGFSGSMDRMALFPVRSNPKWRPWHEMTWHDRIYIEKSWTISPFAELIWPLFTFYGANYFYRAMHYTVQSAVLR